MTTRMTTNTRNSILQNQKVRRLLQYLWLALVLFYVVQLPIRVPFYLQDCGCPPELVASWDEMGVAQLFRVSFTLSNIVRMVVYLSMGALLIFRRTHDLSAVVFAFVFVLVSNGFVVSYALQEPWWQSLERLMSTLFHLGLYTLLYLFPDLRLRPRWLWGIYTAAVVFALLNLLPVNHPLEVITDNAFAPVVIFGIFISIHRYRSTNSPIRQQQLKALLLVLVLALAVTVLFTLTSLLVVEPRHRAILTAFIDFTIPLLFAALPVSIGIALLRHRLFEIDLVINRSLVYGIVTLVVLAIFTAIMLGLQIVIGETQPLIALMIALALSALLYTPVRSLAQRFVDRRVYGFAFDLDQLKKAQQKPEVKNPGALTGKHLGNYEVLGVLGRGGMGEVYKGYGKEQVVALKILPQDLAESEDFRKRFEREAQILTDLKHPNIVQVYEAGQSTDRIYYMAMEFIDGSELGDLLRTRSRLSLAELRSFLTTFTSALDYAHQRGFVHRDLKPSNVMVRNTAESPLDPVLMDFGIAKIRDASTALTGTGAVGTIDYMAPEQIMEAREVDHRADIYALGVVAFELLTGTRPFTGGAGQVLFAHLQQPPPDPREFVPDLPESVAHALLKALAKDAGERFDSAGAFTLAIN
jgi:predicted Ser/Thr protein kinase